jgi:hypothetical protein
MTDPGGGHGWRTARHLPPRSGGVFGRLADRAMPVDDRPLCVLLLPEQLESMDDRERVEELLRGPGVIAVDPPRLSYRAAARLPGPVAEGLATVQARRLLLPGRPAAVVIFDPLQYPLARALLAQHPDAELWYGGTDTHGLHAIAAERAALRFERGEDNRPLWERMERMGVPSGRLGSERSDIE